MSGTRHGWRAVRILTSRIQTLDEWTLVSERTDHTDTVDAQNT